MGLAKGIYPIKGQVQHYDWGGYDFLPQLLGIPNPAHQPFAEYWLGTHPKSPSVIEKKGEKPLADFVELPFLFKMLDVRDMLSIQVHPTKKAAEIEFARENNERIPLDAPYRNYKDDNHKPELACAISEFWLLHGFKREEDLLKILSAVPEFEGLLPYFVNGGYEELYKKVMGMPQDEVNATLQSLLDRIIPLYQQGVLQKNEEDYWAAKAALTFNTGGNADRGIFSVYFFNIVKLNPGEAIFQDAGIPHAYMFGQCAEIMANSDNVLRGGLTSKHIDVKELLKHTRCEAVTPEILPGRMLDGLEKVFKTPAPEFELSLIELPGAGRSDLQATADHVLFLYEGEAVFSYGTVKRALKKGEALFITGGIGYSMESDAGAVLFRAAVPD